MNDNDDELTHLRAQVAAATQTEQMLRFLLNEKQAEHFDISMQLADCQAVIEKRGHDVECPARRCSHPVRGHLCGFINKPHTALPIGHEFQPGPCSTECGHDRALGLGQEIVA